MSVESPAAPAAPAGTTLARVFGVALGLLLLALCAATVVTFGWRTTSASGALAERYELAELPFGFALHPDSFVLPGGERVFAFAPPGSPEGELRGDAGELAPVAEPREPAPGSSPDGPQPVDWAALEPVERGAPPAKLLLVRYPLAAGERVIDRQFRGLEWMDLARIEPKGGSTPVEGGKLEWAGYAADFVRVRRFAAGPTFRDVLRVNLSLGEQCWIAYAVWPPMSDGSTEPVRALLEALRPR